MWSLGVLRATWLVILTSVSSTCSGVDAEQPGELRLGPDLVRHQVEQADAHRANVLTHRVGFAHHHDAFGFERRAGGKVVRES